MDTLNNTSDRRNFLKKAGTLLGVGLTLPVISSVLTSCEQDEKAPVAVVPPGGYDLDLSKYPKLAAVGGVVKVTIPGKNGGAPLVITRKDAATFVVLDSTCPHAGCEVDLPVGASNEMDCPCHHAFFSNLDGSVTKNPVSGWAGEPLKNYKVNKYDSAKNILNIEI